MINDFVNPVHILLIEDNPGDIRLAQEALKEGKVRNTLTVIQDGEEALDFLFHRGEHAAAPRPDLVLLDLNLPKISGREILAQMKTDDSLKTIPVVVLTASEAEEDIIKCYGNHANCYITKPLDFSRFVQITKAIEEFWLTIVKLPPK